MAHTSHKNKLTHSKKCQKTPFLFYPSKELAIPRTNSIMQAVNDLYPLIIFTMTKQDLVNYAAQKAGVTKKDAGAVLDSIIEAITKSLKKGDNVTVTGFGTFRVSKRAARTGVNPRNPGQKIKIPAMKLPAFKAGKSLKDAVR